MPLPSDSFRVLRPEVLNQVEHRVLGYIEPKDHKFEASVTFSEDMKLPPGGVQETQGVTSNLLLSNPSVNSLYPLCFFQNRQGVHCLVIKKKIEILILYY